MKILAFETSSAVSSIALRAGNETFAQTLPEQRQQIKQILPVIDQLLEQAGLNLKQIDGLALSNGPGSFTGLRVGLGVVQGLALAHDIPVTAVSSLQALAQKLYRLEACPHVVCLRNAFMSQFYYAEYQLKNNIMIAAEADKLLSLNDLQYPSVARQCGDGWQLLAINNVKNLVISADAEDVITLAIANQEWTPVETIVPNYLRDKTAWHK